MRKTPFFRNAVPVLPSASKGSAAYRYAKWIFSLTAAGGAGYALRDFTASQQLAEKDAYHRETLRKRDAETVFEHNRALNSAQGVYQRKLAIYAKCLAALAGVDDKKVSENMVSMLVDLGFSLKRYLELNLNPAVDKVLLSLNPEFRISPDSFAKDPNAISDDATGEVFCREWRKRLPSFLKKDEPSDVAKLLEEIKKIKSWPSGSKRIEAINDRRCSFREAQTISEALFKAIMSDPATLPYGGHGQRRRIC